jgi:hypothetical protein
MGATHPIAIILIHGVVDYFSGLQFCISIYDADLHSVASKDNNIVISICFSYL